MDMQKLSMIRKRISSSSWSAPPATSHLRLAPEVRLGLLALRTASQLLPFAGSCVTGDAGTTCRYVETDDIDRDRSGTRHLY